VVTIRLGLPTPILMPQSLDSPEHSVAGHQDGSNGKACAAIIMSKPPIGLPLKL